MPLYNEEAGRLEEAVRSILVQSFEDFEFLIIDDSDDGSQEFVRSFAEEDPRIRHIRKAQHIHLGAKLNEGIREAKGKYIVRMESDDISGENRLERLSTFMEEHPAVDVASSYKYLFGDQKDQEGVWKFPLEDAFIRAGLVWEVTIPQGPSIMKRDFLMEHGHFYREEGPHFAEDWDFFYSMSKDATFQNLPDQLYFYRRGHESTSTIEVQKKERIRTEMYRRILKDMEIPFSEEELFLHRFIKTDPEGHTDPSLIRRARHWLDKLIRYNHEHRIYEPEVFEQVCEEKWDRLFYRLSKKDRTVWAYWKSSPSWKKDQAIFYLKQKVNRFLGRKGNG